MPELDGFDGLHADGMTSDAAASAAADALACRAPHAHVGGAPEAPVGPARRASASGARNASAGDAPDALGGGTLHAPAAGEPDAPAVGVPAPLGASTPGVIAGRALEPTNAALRVSEALDAATGADPFAGLTAVLGASPVHVDPHRQARKGVPEVVYAAGKTPRLTLAAVRALLERQPAGRVLVSRAAPNVVDVLRAELEPTGATVLAASNGSTVLVTRKDAKLPKETGGVVGLLTAGASDAAAADEAAWVAHEMGCRIMRADDVGVAGLHRLEAPLHALREHGADVVIVVAGMDGALPSVVAGLVDVPVIGLPTSVGYGLGGGGVAALLSMLQTCAPGLVVVNIDNGVGAGATAALIANRAAAARSSR